MIPSANDPITFWSRGNIHHVRIDGVWRDHPSELAHTAEGFIVEAEDESLWWERGWTSGETLRAAQLLVQSYSGD